MSPESKNAKVQSRNQLPSKSTHVFILPTAASGPSPFAAVLTIVTATAAAAVSTAVSTAVTNRTLVSARCIFVAVVVVVVIAVVVVTGAAAKFAYASLLSVAGSLRFATVHR